MTAPSQSARLRPFRPVPFGRYTLLSPLATGGMGEIFLARLDGLQGVEKLCVIKKILPHLSSDTDFVERFVNEAKILVKLSHGSIAQVLDVGLHEADPFIALEYVDGKDLRKVAARAKDRGIPLPLTFVLYVMGRVLDALAYAHRKRDDEDKQLDLVHRDVSPQNILISYEGEVKVIDFGLAKSTLNSSKTHPSIILGKFLYMSPEQARHEKVDRRSDLYAVGICMYELISGKNPFDDAPPGELMARVASPNVPPIGEVDPLCPGSVQELITKALQVDPARRFQTAEEFRGKLAACLVEIDPAAGPESVSRYMREAFTTEHQAEHKLLLSLREVNRVAGRQGPPPPKREPPPPSEVQTAVVNLTDLAKPVKASSREGAAVTNPAMRVPEVPTAPLSFAPTPRSREESKRRESVADRETAPGVAVPEPPRANTDEVANPVTSSTADTGERPRMTPPEEPAPTETQPRVVLGSLIEPTATAVLPPPPPAVRPPVAHLPEAPGESAKPKRPRWLLPVSALVVLGAVGGVGYFAMRDWIASLFTNADVTAPGPAKFTVQKTDGTSPLPRPAMVLPATPVEDEGADAGEDSLLATLTLAPAPHGDRRSKRPKKLGPLTPAQKDFFNQWKRTQDDYAALLKKKSREDLGLLNTQYEAFVTKIDDGGAEAATPANRKVMSALDAEIRTQLEAHR